MGGSRSHGGWWGAGEGGVCGRGSRLERQDSCPAQQGESSEVPGTEEREGRDAKAAWPDPARSHAKRPGQPLGQRWGTWDGHMHKEVPDCCRQRPLGMPARLQTGSMQHWALCLTALILWPVGTVEQSLVGILEELVPGHRVYKAEVGVAVDEGQPAAQFPQRAQPQPADAQPLQGQRVRTTVGGGVVLKCRGAAHR